MLWLLGSESDCGSSFRWPQRVWDAAMSRTLGQGREDVGPRGPGPTDQWTPCQSQEGSLEIRAAQREDVEPWSV